MLREAKMLKGCVVRAEDGPIGRVDGVFFDDQSWGVRYLVVDTGGLLSDEKVLILPDFVEEINEAMPASVRVSLTREQVEKSPCVEADRPVAAQQEVDYYAYHGAAPYWGAWEAAGWGVSGPGFPPYTRPDAEAGAEERGDPHLRSSTEVRGYAIRSRDRTIGHVEDFIVDDQDWEIRYVIVDTRDWLPGKKVPLSAAWVSGISWAGAEIEVDLMAEEIRSAPEWSPGTTINRQYETELHAHFGRTPYWIRRRDNVNR